MEDILLLATFSSSGVDKEVEMRQSTVNVRDCVTRMVSLNQHRVREGVTLAIDVADNVPDCIITDEIRVCQVITNLIGNAAKFTLQGKISLSCSLQSIGSRSMYSSRDTNTRRSTSPRDQEAQVCCLKFAVKDTGTGISRANLQILRKFTFFNKLSTEETKQLNVTGTGWLIPV